MPKLQLNSIHRKLYVSPANEYCQDPSNDGEHAFPKGKLPAGKGNAAEKSGAGIAAEGMRERQSKGLRPK